MHNLFDIFHYNPLITLVAVLVVAIVVILIASAGGETGNLVNLSAAT